MEGLLSGLARWKTVIQPRKRMIALVCRSCGTPVSHEVLDLGVQPLANNLLQPGDLEKLEPRFPLRVAVCHQCWLLQITDTVPPVSLFSEYLYFSSFSDSLLQHAKNAAESHIREFRLGPSHLVVEIASNDGYLLKNFVAAGIPCLGIEPAENIAAVAVQKGVPTLSEFFNGALAEKLSATRGKADLILANNVFAHVPDTNDFIEGIRRLMAPGGRAILEFPYACDLIEHLEFDTIYLEHVFYFSLSALVPLFRRNGLEAIQVERLPIHGGSLRLTVVHTGAAEVSRSVVDLLAEEKSKGVTTPAYYEDFGTNVRRIRNELLTLLASLKAGGKSIAAYGASAKGSTLLNFYGLGGETIDFVADRSTAKQGRLTPGTHLPILAAEELERRRPDFALLLTWNFASEILAQQAPYREAGGRFILPVPEVSLV